MTKLHRDREAAQKAVDQLDEIEEYAAELPIGTYVRFRGSRSNTRNAFRRITDSRRNTSGNSVVFYSDGYVPFDWIACNRESWQERSNKYKAHLEKYGPQTTGHLVGKIPRTHFVSRTYDLRDGVETPTDVFATNAATSLQEVRIDGEWVKIKKAVAEWKKVVDKASTT